MSAIKGKCVLEQRRKYLFKVKELFDQGLYAAEIAREVDVPKQTIVNWVRKFNEGFSVNEMMRSNKKNSTAKNIRLVGIKAPVASCNSTAENIDSSVASDPAETLEQKVARLERELRESRMETALYKEIINVAEENFGIKITKKAGAKQ